MSYEIHSLGAFSPLYNISSSPHLPSMLLIKVPFVLKSASSQTTHLSSLSLSLTFCMKHPLRPHLFLKIPFQTTSFLPAKTQYVITCVSIKIEDGTEVSLEVSMQVWALDTARATKSINSFKKEVDPPNRAISGFHPQKFWGWWRGAKEK